MKFHRWALTFLSISQICAGSVSFDRPMKKASLMRYLRTMQDDFAILQKIEPSRTGLNKLKLSGSEQITEYELRMLKNHVSPTLPLILIDLRAEAHGFINNEPVAWDTPVDEKTCVKAEQDFLKHLKENELIEICEPTDGSNNLATHVHVNSKHTEAELARAYGLTYVRLPVKHGSLPADWVIDAFVHLVDTTKKRAWLHVHDLHGLERTTLFLCMADALSNADQVSIDTIMYRQYMLGGSDLREYKTINSIEFLNLFHKFAQEHLKNQISWTAWKKAHGSQA